VPSTLTCSYLEGLPEYRASKAHPNFPTKHLLKDTNLFLREAQDCGLQVDSLEGVRKILETACDLGLAEEDYAALFAAVNPQGTKGGA
jgi:3-hydroxyisobutyrate dehydrogenase-like beta-hydroxyacid dehydrogenase